MTASQLLHRNHVLWVMCFALGGFSSLQAQEIDLLLKGGHVIDPRNQIDSRMDVAIAKGRIYQVAPDIPASRAARVIDVTGLYVTPGLIDMHVHTYYGTDPDASIANGWFSLPPDGFTFRAGVTTVVDAGSSGWRNFPQFKRQTIDRSRTRVLAFLNIVGHGMSSRYEEQDTNDMNPVQTAHMVKPLCSTSECSEGSFPDVLVGIKAAHYWGDFTQVDRAVEAGELAGVPVIVDFGEHSPPLSIEELFMKHLRPGDMFTHTFAHGPGERETVVDEAGKVKPFVFEAQKRGIVFDLGHGGGAFSWRQAVPAMRQGFRPNVISTDLHAASMNGGMKDLCNVMSKFLAMGMSLPDIILRTTWNPATAIRRPELGHLSPGVEADVTVLNLRQGNFGFMDIRRTRLQGTRKVEAELTIRAGEIVWDLNGISAPAWETELQSR